MGGLSKIEQRLIGVCVLVMGLCPVFLLSVRQAEVSTTKSADRVIRVGSQVPEPDNDESTVLHIWRIGDLYARSGQLWSRRPQSELASVSHVLKWESHAGKAFKVQIASRPDFSSRRFHLTSAHQHLNLAQAFVGDNYWRVSQSDPSWSRPAHFHVRAVYLDEMIEVAAPLQRTLEIRNGAAEADIRWSAPPEIRGFVVEISRAPGFEDAATTISRINGRIFRHKFMAAGSYYLRTRGFNSLQQVTEYSPIVEVKVLRSSL